MFAHAAESANGNRLLGKSLVVAGQAMKLAGKSYKPYGAIDALSNIPDMHSRSVLRH